MRFNESCRFPVSLFGELPCESDLTQSERQEKRREKRPKGLTEGHRGDDGRQRVRSPARTPPPPPPPPTGPEGDANDQTRPPYLLGGKRPHKTKQNTNKLPACGVAS